MQTSYDTTTSKGKQDILDAYSEVLKTEPELSFSSFCRQAGVENHKHVLWWANGQGISIRSIQRDAKHVVELDRPSFIQIRPRPHENSPRLGNVSITFPDGVNITLRDSGIDEVISLLDIYRSRHHAEGGAGSCSL